MGAGNEGLDKAGALHRVKGQTDSLLSDRDRKDKGNKDMYSNAFDGKRNRATVQRGYSLVQLLVVMLSVSILAK